MKIDGRLNAAEVAELNQTMTGLRAREHGAPLPSPVVRRRRAARSSCRVLHSTSSLRAAGLWLNTTGIALDLFMLGAADLALRLAAAVSRQQPNQPAAGDWRDHESITQAATAARQELIRVQDQLEECREVWHAYTAGASARVR